MSRFEILKKLMLRHRYQLVLTYILFGLEMTGSLLRPFFLGVAINDLIKGSYQGLILLSVVHLLYVVFGTIRHMLDTRTYSAIYTSLVTRFLSRKIQAADVSRLSAHSTLAKEYVEFLEFDLIYVLEALFNLLGSLALLFFYDRSVVVLCLCILVPVVAISYFYGKKMRRYTRLKNDELEQQVDIISSGDKAAMEQHYNNLRNWQVRISDQEAWNFGTMEILVLLTIGAALLITYKTSGTVMLAGNIVGIYNYVLKFTSGLDTIPYTVQKMSALTDITRRLELQEEDLMQEKPVQPSFRVIKKDVKLSA